MTNDQRKKRKQEFFKRLVISWLVVACVSFAVGGFVTNALCSHITKNQAVSTAPQGTDTPDNKNGQYAVYGAYDDRHFTEEISLDWGGDDLDFQPIPCALDKDIQEFTFYLCAGYNLDFPLVMAMMFCESSYDAGVVSVTNDYGLMQINKINHAELTRVLGVDDFLDPYQNIRAGCFMLRQLFEKYHDPHLVLMAYNMGEGGASNLWERGVYSTSYSEKIINLQSLYYKELGLK